MSTRIPLDAFDRYIALGADRSYQVIADELGVTKRAITKHAAKHEWTTRLETIERKAKEASEKKAVETLEAMNTRHLKSLRVVQGKALEALKSMSLSSAMDAIRALDLSIKHERVIRGEPSDRSAVSVEETIKREFQNWMVPEGRNGNHDHGDADAESAETNRVFE